MNYFTKILNSEVSLFYNRLCDIFKNKRFDTNKNIDFKKERNNEKVKLE